MEKWDGGSWNVNNFPSQNIKNNNFALVTHPNDIIRFQLVYVLCFWFLSTRTFLFLLTINYHDVEFTACVIQTKTFSSDTFLSPLEMSHIHCIVLPSNQHRKVVVGESYIFVGSWNCEQNYALFVTVSSYRCRWSQFLYSVEVHSSHVLTSSALESIKLVYILKSFELPQKCMQFSSRKKKDSQAMKRESLFPSCSSPEFELKSWRYLVQRSSMNSKQIEETVQHGFILKNRV